MTTLPRLRRSPTSRPKAGIVHLGVGAFFRAFNAVFTAEAMAANGGDWGIIGVNLRSPEIRHKLAPQDEVYTVVTLSPDEPMVKVCETLTAIRIAPEDPAAVLSDMASPAIKVVSLTVTEKGYCHNPSSGRLRLDDPDIAFDLANVNAPRTAIGFIVHALNRRRLAGGAPFTVLSCDNLPSNGQLARGVVLEFAQAVDPELAQWITQHGRFPSTMVDRITPATTAKDIADLSTITGYHDPACVMTEPFRQWVIEDDFVDGARPDWDAAGAVFVGCVDVFETMKLRCLNGTHSTLAYLGYLAGYETIADTVGDRAFVRLIEHLWAAEITPTLVQPDGIDLKAYCADLLARYKNPNIRHLTWQIAMDGSQKLPQRLLGTIADNLTAGRDISGLSLAVAGWMRYVSGVDQNGTAIDVRDPLAERLKSTSDAGATPAEKVAKLLEVADVFDPTLAANEVFRTNVSNALDALYAKGARRTVEDFT